MKPAAEFVMPTDKERKWDALAFVPAGLALASLRVLSWLFIEAGPLSAGLIDGGQVLAASLVASLLLTIRVKFTRLPKWSTWSIFCLLSLGVGAFTLRDDFDAFSRRQTTLPQEFALAAAIFCVSLSPVLGAAFGRLLDRPTLRWCALSASSVAVVANGVFLQNDYRGVHLFVAGSSLMTAGNAFVGAPRPAGKTPTIVTATCLLAAISSVLVPVPGAVAQALYNSTGAAYAPLFGWFAQGRLTEQSGKFFGRPEWYAQRSPTRTTPSKHGYLLGEHPVILLITVDALRADILESKKYDDELPTFARLRNEGIYFTQARAPGTLTKTSLSSLFLGNYFSQQFWSPMKRFNNAMSVHADESARFTELLVEHGVHTANFRAVSWLRNGVVMRGFQHDEHITYPREKSYYTPSPPLVRRMDSYLRKRLKRDASAFIYSHLADPHAPYDQGKVQRGPAFERYLSEIALVDSQLKKILATLERSPRRKSTLLILSADHGEAFGEHNSTTHGTTLYDEALHVPLIFWRPSGAHRTVDTPVSLIDLAPTILDLFGKETPDANMGQSLAGYLGSRDPDLTRPIFAETRLMRAFVTSDLMKLIVDTRSARLELYDLKQDPGETENLSGDHEKVLPLLHALNAFFKVHQLKRDGYVPPYVR